MSVLFGASAAVALWAAAPTSGGSEDWDVSAEDLIQQWDEARETGEACAGMVPIGNELVQRDPASPRFARIERFGSMLCARDEKRFADALEALKGVEATGFRMHPTFAVFLASQAKDAPETLVRLQGILADGDPELMGELSPEFFWHIYRFLWREGMNAEVDRSIYAFMQTRDSTMLQPHLESSFADTALGVAADEQDEVAARAMLQKVSSPVSYISLLTSRRYESLWPIIEARAGQGLKIITAEARARSTANFEADPENLENLNDLSHKLLFDGAFEEAIDFVDRQTARPDLFETIEEDEAWALNIKGYALDALGRWEEGDAVFDQLAALDPEKFPWVVNFVINRASRLVGQGRWQEGLAANAVAEPVAQEMGSTYAQALVAKAYVCGYSGKGEAAAAEPYLERLGDLTEDFQQLMAEGLMCAGKKDEAAQLVLSRLEDEKYREGLIDELQPKETELFYTRSLLPQLNELLEIDGELRAVFDRYARTMPTEYLPQASLKKAELPR